LDLDGYIFVIVSSVIECITVANDDHCYSQCWTCISVHRPHQWTKAAARYQCKINMNCNLITSFIPVTDRVWYRVSYIWHVRFSSWML